MMMIGHVSSCFWPIKIKTSFVVDCPDGIIRINAAAAFLSDNDLNVFGHAGDGAQSCKVKLGLKIVAIAR